MRPRAGETHQSTALSRLFELFLLYTMDLSCSCFVAVSAKAKVPYCLKCAANLYVFGFHTMRDIEKPKCCMFGNIRIIGTLPTDFRVGVS